MEYTPSQKDKIRAYIRKKGYTVNEQGCEVWTSSENQPPYYKVPLENGAKKYVNIRRFLWMRAHGEKVVKHLYTSCANNKCIKLEHIVPGERGPALSSKYVFTVNDLVKIQEKIANGISIDEDGCEVWNDYMVDLKYPSIQIVCDDKVKRSIRVPRLLWTQANGTYDYRQVEIAKTCNKDRCLKLDHFRLEVKNKSADHDHVWKLIKQKTTVDDEGCLILDGKSGYSQAELDGVRMQAHRVVFIIKNNNGEPIPEYDDDGDPLVIRHICNKANCVNAAHLKLGTRSQNSHDDRLVAGTVLRGAKNPKSTITEDLAQKIKLSKRDKGESDHMTQPKRATLFGVSKGIVNAIDNNKSWAHLPDRYGVIAPNDDLRRKNRERARLAGLQIWTEQDFVAAGEKIRENIVESFEGKAGEMPPGACWLWQKSDTPHGYGNVAFKGKLVRSHILSCEVKYGRRARKGEVVRHRCSNPPCGNPDHLVFGSRKDNAIDNLLYGTSKGRKFNPDSVRRVRASKKSNAELAEQYGVHRRAIFNIRTGRTWSSVV